MKPQIPLADDLVLIVDDNLTNREFVSGLLRSEGYGVCTAADAEDALQLLNTFRPRLILMDIELPGMNGLDLTRRLKADTRASDMTVVAFTACAAHEAEQHAFEAGCDGYISKPIGARSLVQRVAEYLQRDNPIRPEPRGGCAVITKKT